MNEQAVKDLEEIEFVLKDESRWCKNWYVAPNTLRDATMLCLVGARFAANTPLSVFRWEDDYGTSEGWDDGWEELPDTIGDVATDPACKYLAQVIEDKFPERFDVRKKTLSGFEPVHTRITDFNDHADTTHADVLLVIDEARTRALFD